jgi:deoxyribodipyrimidine photo-lyase
MTVIAACPVGPKKRLAEHAADQREQIYDRNSLAAGETHDPYWNAAMAEMRHTGFMHNYMRMYWGKKILEWTPSRRTSLRYCPCIEQ